MGMLPFMNNFKSKLLFFFFFTDYKMQIFSFIFFLSSTYRLKGKERMLDKKCGTLPYVAPEVLVKPYYAQPADIFSCGIILVTMLAGGKY